jgi:hypothetical protein
MGISGQESMSTQEAIIESLAGISITSFKGHCPTAMDINTLEKELAIIAATVKTSLFEGGQLHSHLCNVISNESYAAIMGNPNFVLEEPALPEAYNPEILPQMGEVQHKTLELEWDKHKQHYQAYLGVQEILRKRIRFPIPPRNLQQVHGIPQTLGTSHCQPHQGQGKTHHHRKSKNARPSQL